MLKYLYIGVIHVILIGVCIYAYNKSNSYNRLETQYENAKTFDKPNEVIKYIQNLEGDSVQHSKPHIAQEDVLPISTKKLLDSVSELIKIPSNGKITSYTKVPISSAITAKATRVTDTLAEYENDNWYLSYNTRDSVFNGRYKSYYNQADYDYKLTTLGFSTGKPINVQSSWLSDKNASIGKTTSIIVEKPKKSTSFNLNNVNKFRSLDNSLLTGGEASITKGRHTIGGQYLYNVNSKKTEWEIQYKFGIVK